MSIKQAVFYQETGEDAFVQLTDEFTLEDAKERYPEWRFRFLQTKPIFLELDWYHQEY